MFETFEEFLATSKAQIPTVWFIINLSLTAILALILSKIYIRYGTSLSNRRMFGRNFLLITMTTMFIITIIKSSLALSLGLVGALSIIRFRAAIKEPEELAYLFLAIAIGLGFGANQGIITVIAFGIITVVIVLVNKFYQDNFENQNLHLTVSSHNPSKIDVDRIVEILKEHCSVVRLKRLDESGEAFEVSFLVELEDYGKLVEAKKALQELDETMSITYMDNRGLI